MLFMVIERYKNRDAKSVYHRFKEKGRMMPEGLQYVGSWVEDNFDRCFIVHVVSSAEAADAALSGRDLPGVPPSAGQR